MLRPCPVKVAFALTVLALDRLAVFINRLQNFFCPALLPAVRGAENPLHFLIAANLDGGGLVAGRNDDRVIRRIVIDGIDVGPVAACADTHNVTEVVAFIHFGKFSGADGLTGLGGINIETHCALIKRLDDVVAVRIENFHQAEIVNDAAVLINFYDNVANGMNASAVGTAVVCRTDAQEGMSVLCVVKGMREIRITRRQTTVIYLAADEIVLAVVLAVAPGERAILGLLEPHEVSRFPGILIVADLLIQEPPADFALRVDDADIGIKGPFHRAAGRVVPNEAAANRHGAHELRIDEVEAIGKIRINMDGLDFKRLYLIGHAG